MNDSTEQHDAEMARIRRGDRRRGPWVAAIGSAVAGAAGLALHVATGNPFVALAGIGLVALCAAGIQNALSRPVADALSHILDSLEAMARGETDFEVRRTTLGDYAPFGEILETLRSRERELEADVTRVLERLQAIPEQVLEAMLEIDSGRESTEEAVEETAGLLANINTSIRSINGELERLSVSTEEVSSSILEMQSSTDEVARSAGQLNDEVESSSTSIHEISASIRQVAESADAVQAMAEESAAAMTEMDRAIQEVGEHVREASGLTAQVNLRAEEGTKSVAATIEGIERISDQTRGAKHVLERLAERIGEIGEIVNVIGGINDETNLLSLNAAIIAAQAGEQGKAFAVVANHVKILAQRTAQSTREIDALIRAVQDESSNAVEAMAAGIESVETGVERSRKAGEELETIRLSSHEASQRVSEIARATGEQTRNSKHVAEAAQRTSTMVQQISRAMTEQSRAGDAMLRNAESALDLCRQVHRATEEQRESNRFVTASVNATTEMIRSIQSSTGSHSTASEAVADAVGRILEVARKSGERTPEVIRCLEELRQQARTLAGATRRDL